MSLMKRCYSQTSQPPWLRQLLQARGPAPKLYAWNPSNLHTSPSYKPSTRGQEASRRIYVLGVGNIGRLYASCLARSENPPPVTLVVHKKEKLSQWMEGPGLELERGGFVDQNKDFDIEWWTETAPEEGRVREVADGGVLDNVIIATKTPVALSEMDKMRRYLGSSSTVAFAQNGMNKMWPPHGAMYLSNRFPAGDCPNILHCITTSGIVSKGVFSSNYIAPAGASVGPVHRNEASQGVSEFLMKEIARAPYLMAKRSAMADLWIQQLEKLVINAHINGFTAILRCKNGALFGDYGGIMDRVQDSLLRESSRVLQALIQHESSAFILASEYANRPHETSAQSVDAVKTSLVDRFSQRNLKAKLYAVAEQVKDNTSSMLQDVMAGNKTEVRDMNGWFVDTAAYIDPTISTHGHDSIVKLVESNETLTKEELGRYFV